MSQRNRVTERIHLVAIQPDSWITASDCAANASLSYI
jgi:hypothetical protein